jgi:hypothetical protein
MSILFRRSVKILPGLRVNFSKRGASVSVGPRGMGVTIGNHGTTVHAGIPGTGLYMRQKVGSVARGLYGTGSTYDANDYSVNYQTDYDQYGFNEYFDRLYAGLVKNADEDEEIGKYVQELTDSCETERKWNERLEIYNNQYSFVEDALDRFSFGKLFRTDKYKKRRGTLEDFYWFVDAYKRTRPTVNFTYDDYDKAQFANSYSSLDCLFKQCMARLIKIEQDGTDNMYINRQIGGEMVDETPFITNIERAFKISNRNSLVMFLPKHLFLYSNGAFNGFIKNENVHIDYQNVGYIQPDDYGDGAEIVGTTYLHTNMNGSPDMRYRDNPRIPIVKYSIITFTLKDGMNVKMLIDSGKVGEQIFEVLKQFLHS